MKPMEQKLTHLLQVVQDLSMAKTINDITRIVRTAARELTGSDGATFVLRDGDLCYYADEDAIAPLWKGKRFPMKACISGWVMLNATPTVIPDIYVDPRIPADAYRPTFVKSLAMVPIRTKSPIGAIGNYWASHKEVTPDELKLIQALADSTSIAIENIQLYNELERKVAARTAELEAFSYAVSHDLKAPVRGISGFAGMLEDEFGAKLDADALDYLHRIQNASVRMSTLIDALLELSKTSRAELKKIRVDLTQLAREILNDLKAQEPERQVKVSVQDNMSAFGDQSLLRAVLDNLLRNAWKFSRNTKEASIEVGAETTDSGGVTYFVKDNGAGFDSNYQTRLFKAFQRLHSNHEYEGTGIGLATAQRIITRHGGHIFAKGEIGKGAQFYFDLPRV